MKSCPTLCESMAMGFSRQEYWSGLPFSSPGDLPNPGIEPGFPALQADSLLAEPPGKTRISWFEVYFPYLPIRRQLGPGNTAQV